MKFAQTFSSKFSKDKDLIEKERMKMNEEEESDDEYYDRAKTCSKAIVKPEAQNKTETYETLKQKLEALIKERSNLLNKLQALANSAASDEEDELEKYVGGIKSKLNEESKNEAIEELKKVNKNIDEYTRMLQFVTPTMNQAEKPKEQECSKLPSVKEIKTNSKEGLNDAIGKLMMMENAVMKKIYEQPAEEQVEEEEEIKEKSINKVSTEVNDEEKQSEAEVQGANQNLPITNKEFFKEIISNLNKDSIDLNDYKAFNLRYTSLQKKAQELESARGQKMNQEAGLQFFNFKKEEPKPLIPSEKEETPPQKVYTAVAKPVPRDNAEDNDEEDTTKYV